MNTYAYVLANPLSYVDPKGLATQCSSGLNALGGKQYGGIRHEFSCYTTRTGFVECRGLGRDPNGGTKGAIINWVRGIILKDADNFSPDTTCEPDDKNKCMDQCIADFYAGMERDPPRYTWTRDEGMQCKEANRSVANDCKQMCKVK